MCGAKQQTTISVPEPTMHGWKAEGAELILQPDFDANMNKQKTIFDTLMKKCGCKSSQCLTNRCGCRKSGSKCTSLCDFLNCKNSKNTYQSGIGRGSTSSYDPVEIIEDEDIAVAVEQMKLFFQMKMLRMIWICDERSHIVGLRYCNGSFCYIALQFSFPVL